MFAKSVIALAAVASLAGAAPIEKKGAPAGWAYGYLEDYDTYHVRYLALKCYEKKNTDYFQDCCRPMLATQTLQDNRDAKCIPSKEDTAYVVSSLSAQAAGGQATATASADKEVESEYCESEESVSVSSAAAATSAAASSAAAESSKAAVQYLAPAPTTTSSTPAWTPAPAPTTTSTTPAWTPAPAPATTQQAQPQSNNNGQSFNGGYATYFYQGGNAGACGQVHSDWDMIVAIDHEQWGDQSFGGGSNTCGRWLTVTNTKNGKSVVAKVADVCPTCANGNSLDLSQGAFNAIATESEGQVPISWHWN